MSTVWYVRLNDEIHGPYDGDHLLALAYKGHLKTDTPVREGENANWVTANEIPFHDWSYVKKDRFGEASVLEADELELIELVRNGELELDSRVASSGRTGGQWREVKDVPGLHKSYLLGQQDKEKQAALDAAERQRLAQEHAELKRKRLVEKRQEKQKRRFERERKRQQRLAAMPKNKSALWALFVDVRFKYFITPEFISAIYVAVYAVTAFASLAVVATVIIRFVVSLPQTWNDAAAIILSLLGILISLVTAIVVFLVVVVTTRIVLEGLMVIFRIAEHLEDIVELEKQKKTSASLY